MKTGVELIAETQQQYFQNNEMVKVVVDALLAKSIYQLFDGNNLDTEINIGRLSLIGGLIAAEIDRLQKQ